MSVIFVERNLNRIYWTFLGAFAYYMINHFFNGILQEIINQSNFVQSCIVFLSLASLINIVRPFSLRKELSIKEVDELIKKRQEDLVENFEDYKNKYGRTTGYR